MVRGYILSTQISECGSNGVNRKLLLSRINYHRRSEFTEKISHRRNNYLSPTQYSKLEKRIDTVHLKLL